MSNTLCKVYFSCDLLQYSHKGSTSTRDRLWWQTDIQPAGDCREKTTKPMKIYGLDFFSLETLQEKITSDRKTL